MRQSVILGNVLILPIVLVYVLPLIPLHELLILLVICVLVLRVLGYLVNAIDVAEVQIRPGFLHADTPVLVTFVMQTDEVSCNGNYPP